MEKILTPCILQTVIICITIVILGIVSVAAYRISKGQQRSWGSYIFSSSIFLTIAIATFSWCYCDNRNVLDFISLASAIISIILAVVTIVYSYFINSRSSSQIEQLNRAALDVSRATSSYDESAKSLEKNIQIITNAINRVEEKTDIILNSNFASKRGQNNNFANFDLDAYIKGYVNLSSPVGIMIMYACVKSKDCDKDLSLNILRSEFDKAYAAGYIISATSAGFITAQIDFNTDVVKCSNYIDKIKENIEEWIIQFDFSTVENLQNLKDAIDQYFNNDN